MRFSRFYLLVFVCFLLANDADAQITAWYGKYTSWDDHQAVITNLKSADDPGLEDRMKLVEAYYLTNQSADARQHIPYLLNSGKSYYKSIGHLYEGLIAMDHGQFRDAMHSLKKALSGLEAVSERQLIQRLILQAESASLMMKSEHLIKRLPSINSENHEWHPMWSDNYWGRLYFSRTNGSQNSLRRAEFIDNEVAAEDDLGQDSWEYVAGVFEEANRIVGVSANGNTKVVDTLGGLVTEDYPYNPEEGDCFLHVVHPDVVVFASERPRGYGGLDLYISIKVNGRWLPAKNLGPEINSAFNEVDPHFSLSSGTLWFASDRIESAGRFDLFKMRLNYQRDAWSTLEHPGLGMNSVRDDRFPSLREDGFTLLFASDRMESTGGMDIFQAYLSKPDPDRNITFDQVYEVIYKKLASL